MRTAAAAAATAALLALVAGGCGLAARAGDSRFQPGTDAAGLYYERGLPSGVYGGKPPRGAVLLIHGGSWHIVGRKPVRSMRPDASRLNALGFETLNVDYHPGRASFGDVLRSFADLRRSLGPRMPICAFGVSAGGHLALMLAERRSDVACVVAEAPPTLLPRLRGDVLEYARLYFGEDGDAELRAWSPALGVKHLGAPTLVAQAENDHTVPIEQSAALVRADPQVQRIVLRAGPTPWVHSRVDSGDLARLDAAEDDFIEQAAQSAQQELTRVPVTPRRVSGGRASVSDTRSPHRLRETGGPDGVRGT